VSQSGVVIAAVAEVFPQPLRGGQPLSTLPAGCLVAVTERAPKWLTLRLPAEGGVGPQTGFVEASCVEVVDPDGRGYLAARRALLEADVEAPSKERLASGGGALEAGLARAWNLYGGVLSAVSRELGIDPAYAVAVLCVESGGQGFGADGRVIIRFENHIFRRYLDAARAAEFDRHFRITGDQSWLGHAFRESPSHAWTAFHGSQPLEWAAFEVASRLDADAAARSISMGLPQVMGFNHALLGYPSPRGMLAFMGADVRFQLLGLFDFVAGADGRGPALAALRRGDFDAFATLYNGPGQARYYGDLIHRHVQAFHRLKPAGGGGTASTSASDAGATPASSGARRTYEVRPGDTLSAIAGRFGVTVADLVTGNGIANPDRIHVGQVIAIPEAAPAPPPVVVPSAPPEDVAGGEVVDGHVYVVRPGDTLGAIAKRAGTTAAALAQANAIVNSDLIYPGQVIRTPASVA